MSKPVKTASDILGIKDLREERVFVKEWGTEVIVREFSGRELQSILSLESFKADVKAGGNFAVMDAARVCAIAIKDEDGKRIFTDEQAEDLANKSVNAIMFVFHAALRISGLTSPEMEKEKNA